MPRAALCVHCRTRPVEPRWRPFCSERCRLADLGRWLGGEFRIPGTPLPEAENEDADDERDARNTGGR